MTRTARPSHQARGRRVALPHGAFGSDRFALLAERFARLFGTPGFLIEQSLFVVGWIAFDGLARA